jgi:hypothetical protein
VPIGCGVWLAHYAFHFLTGLGTIVPVGQSAAIDASAARSSASRRGAGSGCARRSCSAAAVGAVILGGIGSTSLIQRISERDYRGHAAEAGAPWVVIAVGLTALALWILIAADGHARHGVPVVTRLASVLRGCLARQARRCALVLTAQRSARHSGPPFPIVSSQIAGAYDIAIWTDPDATDDAVAAGQFWVVLKPQTARRLPGGHAVTVAIRATDRPAPS